MIAKVRRWDNDQVEAWNEFGERLPFYCGKYVRVWGIIMRDAPAACAFEQAVNWGRLAAMAKFPNPIDRETGRPRQTRIAVVPRRYW
jgi:hypothetical protein